MSEITPDWFHLMPYGYAPGSYMNRCMHCTNVVAELDKRAVSCRPCAAKVHEIARLREREKELEQEAALRDDALNTLAKLFHSGEEVEGDDGAAMLVDMALWNEGCEALESLIGDDEEATATP